MKKFRSIAQTCRVGKHPLRFLAFLLTLGSLASLPAETMLHYDYLYLNTTIESNSSFIINGADANNNVALTLGEPSPPLSYTFTYTGTNIVSITISSANALGAQMRLKHLEADAFIPYGMRFDYDGQGPASPQAVSSGIAGDLVKYNGVYENLQGSIEFITPADDIYLAGDYKDTITFSFTGI